MPSFTPISGLIAAPFTPLRSNGALHLTPISRYAKYLAGAGVRGAFICGTTGEGASLTTAERMQVAVAWRRARPRGFAVIVHVGNNCQADSCELARHAQKIGADAIATVAPSFFRPANIADLVEWCAPIAAAAPRLPFYYYHIPSMAGADFPMTKLLALAARRIPSFAGIKYTHDNLMDFGNTLTLAGKRHAVLAGRDEILLSYLVIGARGAVGSTYNYAAPIYRRLIEAHEAGDRAAARRWQALVRRFIGVMIECGGLAANKAMMKLVTGIDCGPVRPPLRNLTAAEVTRLRRGLQDCGLFAGLAEAQGR
ncbi:MAG: dihydrodipicolinate synthase family protein [Opitutaceae bacterium]|nr:dihydrodipicolinate synthase family protein [Opitutaceae bacterium]